MPIQLDFNGKVVVVIGGTSGVCRGIAERFAALGAKVAVASRKQVKVDDTVAALRQLGTEAFGFTADVREFEAVDAGLATVHQQFGEFDVVVSGAAGNFPALLRDLSPNGFRSVVDIDLRGTFHVMKASFPRLRKPGACVINISAPQAYLPIQAQVHVCAAKAGVDMITRTLAMEWGASGVRINSVVPGPIDGTEGMARLAPNEQARQAVIASVPLGRMGLPADIANACLFLASDLGSFITGAVLPVDGGWSQTHCGTLGDALSHYEPRQR
ncbi:MAG TPA: SDR family oxidoreductase [Pirellulales bacterium]|jgi:NAD(P)-dependent dehydrogenase (short-subunit alcohol dehydrogenase family)|nr:SDR family oxidoreductase [Pirellulales bacterium]